MVERVDVQGVAETDLSAKVRGQLQTVVGQPLGSDDVEELEERLRTELSRYEVRRRVRRGNRAGEIRLTFLVARTEAARWLHFEPLASNVLYHSDQGWGASLGLPISGRRDLRITPIIAIDNGDDLIEEYSGFGLRFESRKLGTERLGASLEWSTFDPSWRDVTLAALAATPDLPGAYDDRSTITPLVTFTLTQRFESQWRRQHQRGRAALRPLRLADGQCRHRVDWMIPASVGA